MHRTDKYSQNSSIIQASLAKWLSVRLRTKWLWGRISLLSIELRCRDSNEMCVTILNIPTIFQKRPNEMQNIEFLYAQSLTLNTVRDSSFCLKCFCFQYPTETVHTIRSSSWNAFHRMDLLFITYRKFPPKNISYPLDMYLPVSGSKKCKFFLKFPVRTKWMIPWKCS